MTYAAETKVGVDQTRAEIERTLARYGAKSFAYFNEGGRSIIVFEAKDRRIRFDLTVPEGEDNKSAQARRSRWRAMLLCIKAKLESVESKIETFEQAFYAHVVLPDGLTVFQHTNKTIAAAYKTGNMQSLLPDYTKKE